MHTKKDSKNIYKQMKFRAGIFQIKNLKNGKLYLETSCDLERAYNSDKFQLNSGLHSNKELQSDWNNLGSDQFEFSVIDELKIDDDATEIKIKSDLKEFAEMYRTELLKKGENLYK